MDTVIVKLEEFPYWENWQEDLKMRFGLPSPEEKIYSDIKKTYEKYMRNYATYNIIVVTDKVEEQLYKVMAYEIKVVRPSKLTDILNNKEIEKVVNRKYIDQTEITYKDGDSLRWFTINSKDAEMVGLKEKTKRLHKKSPEKIKKENRIITAIEILKIILPIPLIIYSIKTENIAGLGVMLGISITFLIIMIADKKKTDLYEHRI